MAELNMAFNKKSIAVFNNTVFRPTTIGCMPTLHPSVARLYEAAKELKKVTGQSAVARLMDVSPQVVKNWEVRGLSEKGALHAQRAIGCNANWLLDGAGSQRDKPWAPALRAQHIVAEPDRGTLAWPFKTIQPSALARLTPSQLKHVEEGILMLLEAKANAENPPGPQRFGAAA